MKTRLTNVIDMYRESDNVQYIERMINGAIRENKRGLLDYYCAIVLVPEFGAEIASEIKLSVEDMDTAIVSIIL